jgi:hypothetical protein
MRVVVVEVMMIIILAIYKEKTVVTLLTGIGNLLAIVAARPRGRGEGFSGVGQCLII